MRIPHRSCTHLEIFRHEAGPFELNRDTGEDSDFLDLPRNTVHCSHQTTFYRREDDGVWYKSFAFCSIRDHFSKKVGRQVARRKYFQGKKVVCPCPIKDEAGTLQRMRERQYKLTAT